MKEELQKALGELLSKANSGIDTAGEFLASELPDVIQQLLMWHGIYNLTLFLISFAAAIIATTLTVKVFLNMKVEGHWSANDTNTELSGTGGSSLILSVILVVLFLFTINLQWLQIWVAPKVWLLEYAAKLAS